MCWLNCQTGLGSTSGVREHANMRLYRVCTQMCHAT